MANRLLPFRQYNEHFVINLFSLDLAGATLADFKHDSGSSGDHDAGLLVKPWTAGSDIGAGYDEDANALNSYLGKTDYPHVARNLNPGSFAKFQKHGGGTARPMGITLNQTLAFDENGEKMLYYRQKLLEHQGVLPGEVVPVLTKGIVTLSELGFDASKTYSPGDELYVGEGSQAGKLTNDVPATGYATSIGYVIAAGGRNDDNGPYDGANNPDYFAGNGDSTTTGTGKYIIINLDL